ncbi:Formiminotetrahydrofolate cyclodeaminase [Butyrivibrio fibrisolvens DSM 3071]|uniref:Formiminotetrahydrofolate cyclodeaminase n=1 Tax=Butyrivibrio fibrisolvens DSM 3071 TaxID=1121131 RepID=A0A1M6AT83_BUTFI|nr:cyclodeaminase/cyclohydrolase family protein [Butyrivibrio fibrisolvens]SHI39675.1 Formiminotetrahydrofolate cyclodeaminase [Butyrivibrio fibrisolvens DSM 3071]
MDNKITDYSCNEFAGKLAAKVSVPGGGGAAALVGALSMALCSMAGNFTTGKKKYAQYEEELQAILKEAEDIRTRLLDLVEEDAKMFEPLSVAYSIPKEDPQRVEKLEKATLDAIAPPLEMMRQIKRVIELLERMKEIGSVIMISDVGCGAALAGAALKSASLNVFINTKSLQDRDKADSFEQEADSILDEYVARAQNVFDDVNAKLRK